MVPPTSIFFALFAILPLCFSISPPCSLSTSCPTPDPSGCRTRLLVREGTGKLSSSAWKRRGGPGPSLRCRGTRAAPRPARPATPCDHPGPASPFPRPFRHRKPRADSRAPSGLRPARIMNSRKLYLHGQLLLPARCTCPCNRVVTIVMLVAGWGIPYSFKEGSAFLGDKWSR